MSPVVVYYIVSVLVHRPYSTSSSVATRANVYLSNFRPPSCFLPKYARCPLDIPYMNKYIFGNIPI